MTDIDPRELRTAFGAFMTGVTVTTTKDADGAPRGFTANSFTSVSLDPPLLLVCIGKNAGSRAVFEAAEGFAVNILAESQQALATVFASRVEDRFAQVAWRDGPLGHPVLTGAAAWFDCRRHGLVDAGDHIILIGRIEAFEATDAPGLGYSRGAYFTLGLEQDAVAAAGAVNLTIGAVVERDGMVLLERGAEPGTLRAPSVGRQGRPGSVERLKRHLAELAPEPLLGPLYAVFENAKIDAHAIFYRGFIGQGPLADGVELHPVDALPFERIADASMRSMLRRYADEHHTQRFGIYYGDEEAGEVRFMAP